MRGTRTTVVTDTVLLGWLTLRTLCGIDSGQKVKLRVDRMTHRRDASVKSSGNLEPKVKRGLWLVAR
jgi:hypothetical protein